MECDAVVAEFVLGVFNFVKILHFAGPILLILALGINFARGVINPDSFNDKGKKYYINSILAAVVLFMLPTLINVSVDILDPNSNFELTQCWKNAQSYSNNQDGPVDDPDSDALEKALSDADTDGDGKVDNHEAYHSVKNSSTNKKSS